MGVSTTGFVLTEKKDVFAVLDTMETVLTELVRKYAKDLILFRDKTSNVPTIECSPITRSSQIHFKVNDENRMLSVHFDCDCDYKEYGEAKIIWSVNYWGMAEILANELISSNFEGCRDLGNTAEDLISVERRESDERN